MHVCIRVCGHVYERESVCVCVCVCCVCVHAAGVHTRSLTAAVISYNKLH